MLSQIFIQLSRNTPSVARVLRKSVAKVGVTSFLDVRAAQ